MLHHRSTFILFDIEVQNRKSKSSIIRVQSEKYLKAQINQENAGGALTCLNNLKSLSHDGPFGKHAIPRLCQGK